ncbi:DUF4844 domain-containing protein [Aquimarina sp. AD10]|nr:DUF4844 domain-containing protein [Aquimarina sp. AD10]RKM92451.1 DUF4844 domain-containing protein [Aquimarina sp. AD10]
MAKYIQISLILLTLSACGQNVNEMKTPENANEMFAKFIAKKKFVEQPYPNFYPGIVNEKMRPIFTEKIDLVTTDFKTIAQSKKPTDIKYQEKIGIGLSRFTDIYQELDTEDRERVCMYFEELMDIVGLESSNGQLNKFMYGFDPMEQPKEKKWTDSHGNIFIEKGTEVSIIPVKYDKTGKKYKVFLYNETTKNIGIIEGLIIKPKEFKVFNVTDTDTLKLENGVKFMFGETYGLEVEDKKSQVSGLGGKYLTDYGVPNEIDFAFVIVPVGKGD